MTPTGRRYVRVSTTNRSKFRSRQIQRPLRCDRVQLWLRNPFHLPPIFIYRNVSFSFSICVPCSTRSAPQRSPSRQRNLAACRKDTRCHMRQLAARAGLARSFFGLILPGLFARCMGGQKLGRTYWKAGTRIKDRNGSPNRPHILRSITRRDRHTVHGTRSENASLEVGIGLLSTGRGRVAQEIERVEELSTSPSSRLIGAFSKVAFRCSPTSTDHGAL